MPFYALCRLWNRKINYLQNVRNYEQVELITSEERLRKYTSKQVWNGKKKFKFETNTFIQKHMRHKMFKYCLFYHEQSGATFHLIGSYNNQLSPAKQIK